MSFLYPLGLLGLIGIPILIIIYIIKTKYTEQTVASTYLWILSERFLKRKNPFSKITGIISLLLQILAIALISIGIAHPMFTVAGAANEYCFILDASASMNLEQAEGTRFDAAKAQISAKIEEAAPGSRYTLICAGSDTVVVYEKITNKDSALSLLGEQEAGFDEDSLRAALEIAQRYFNEDPTILVSVYTDADHRISENMGLVNVAGSERNFGLSNVSYTLSDGRLSVVGDLVSYGGDDALEVSLYVDEAKDPSATYLGVVSEGQSARFQLSCKLESFSSLRIAATCGDDLALDDELYIYDIKSDSAYNTLIVSDNSFFLKTVLTSLGHINYSVVTTAEFETELGGNVSGYGLYIFDSYSPQNLPGDGAVWMLNPNGSTQNSGFSVQGNLEDLGPCMLDQTNSSASLAKSLLKGVGDDSLFLSQYVKCGTYRNFTTLYTYKGNPVIFAGTNAYGNREVVIAFDLHNSNLPMQTDFVALMRNFLEYSFPEVIESTNYYVGDTAQINVIANCDSIRVETPQGGVSYLSTDTAVAELALTQTGTYTVTATVEGTERQFKLFAAIPEAERSPVASVQTLSLQGEAVAGGFDGEYDPLLILFVCLAVIFAAEWGVYCYEKRQLR